MNAEASRAAVDNRRDVIELRTDLAAAFRRRGVAGDDIDPELDQARLDTVLLQDVRKPGCHWRTPAYRTDSL